MCYSYVISKTDNKVLGFIVATQKEQSLLHCLSVNSLFSFFMSVIKDIKKLKEFVIAVHKLYLTKKISRPTKNRLELSHFSVKKGFKGKKLGSHLIMKLEQKAKTMKYDTIFSKTHNVSLMSFYQRSRQARLLNTTPLGNYDLMLVEWNI